MKKQKTNREFAIYKFDDAYGVKCSIQKSSHIVPRVWLGADDANPQILSSNTEKGGTGWVPYEIPKDVLLTTRMHLNKNQCKKLIKIMQNFVDTEDI